MRISIYCFYLQYRSGANEAGKIAPSASRDIRMQLLDHVSIAVGDLAAARPFYDAVMGALGCTKVYDHADALG